MAPQIDGKTSISLAVLLAVGGLSGGLLSYLISAKSDWATTTAEIKGLRKDIDDTKKSQESYQIQVLATLDAIRMNTATNGKDVAVLRAQNESTLRLVDSNTKRLDTLEGRLRDLENQGKK